MAGDARNYVTLKSNDDGITENCYFPDHHRHVFCLLLIWRVRNMMLKNHERPISEFLVIYSQINSVLAGYQNTILQCQQG